MHSCEKHYSFTEKLKESHLFLKPLSIETLQLNITKLCNQACHHCHVDASPTRTEQMDLSTIQQCLKVLGQYSEIKNLDITGGAPELNPHFEYLVHGASELNKHISVRHNLTVTFDGNPQTGESKNHLPKFFAENGVEVISSLPYYQEYFTDKQRGKGVFEKSIESLRLLNKQGYGMEDGKLQLNLVYNPVGAYLPAQQEVLETDFKRELSERFGIQFNRLFAITNMPIHRFKDWLVRTDKYDDYMLKLIGAFNSGAANSVMCRNLISVGHDGVLYDCDFNQMLAFTVGERRPYTIFEFEYGKLLDRDIRFGSHCFGCTAGSGSSCSGSLESRS